MGNRLKKSTPSGRRNPVATKRDIQALAMGMAANIDNLAIGLTSAVRFMQKQHQLILREIARNKRQRRA